MDHSSYHEQRHYISVVIEPISLAMELVSMPLGTYAFNKVSDLITMVGVSKIIPYQRHHPY